MNKYLCHCGEEIKTLVCSWDQGQYYGRPVLATSGLYCLIHGEREHQSNLNHSNGRVESAKYIDKIFYINLSSSTKEIALKHLLAQVIPQLDKLYLPKTDLRKCLSLIKKV